MSRKPAENQPLFPEERRVIRDFFGRHAFKVKRLNNE